jgi:hypothetical protein
MLMLEKEGRGNEDHVLLGNCWIVEAGAANDKEVRRGIAMDDRLKGFEPIMFSFGGFARRTPEPWDH